MFPPEHGVDAIGHHLVTLLPECLDDFIAEDNTDVADR
jgi:hypothetical protein